MTASASAYGAFTSLLVSGFDYVGDTIKCALLFDTYSPDIDTDAVVDDIVAHELTDGSYARVAVSGKGLSYDDITNRQILAADDAVFPSLSSANIRFAAFFKDTGDDSTSILMGYIDFGANQSVFAQDFVVDLSVTGMSFVEVIT